MRPALISLLVQIVFIQVGWGAPDDDKIDRRSLFKKMRDAFVEGKMSREEKRVLDRKANEKLRRRAVFERNINKLVDGVSARLRRGPRQLTVYIFISAGVVGLLCYKGSMGCEKKKDSE